MIAAPLNAPPAVPRSLPAASLSRAPLALLGAGAAAFPLGLFLAPHSAWSAYLVGLYVLTTAALSGAVFTALYHVCGGRWGHAVVPLAHRTARALPFAGVGFLAMAFGASVVHPWADPVAVASDHALSVRAGWMTVPFVLARTAACFALWIVAARALAARSSALLAAAGSGRPADELASARAGAAKASAVFLLVVAPTFSLFAFDWFLSIERTFVSTLFAVYHLGGVLLAGAAIVTLLVVGARRAGRIAPPAYEDVLHDLGKLVFAFAFFWGYLWYCQYMLVWYTNLPEETPHYVVRHRGPWEPLTVLSVTLNWLLPFVLLLPRAAKRKEALLVRVCALVLVGRVVDGLLAVVPPGRPHALPTFVLELGLVLAAAGAFLWATRGPVRDPGAPPPAPDPLSRR